MRLRLRGLHPAITVVTLSMIGFVACTPSAEGEVTIYRDQAGVPHIYGDSDDAVHYGEGWAQAEDHLEAMLTQYLAATGRLAERKANTAANIGSDQVSKLLRIEATVTDLYATVPAPTRSAVEAFVDGVNDWMGANSGETPSWAWTVTPADVVSLGYYAMMGRQLTAARGDLTGAPGCGPQGCASNGWVADGSITASGNVIVIADPHVPWIGGNQWWEKHLSTPAHSVYGAGLIGLPGVIMGANETLAWSLTSTSQDRGDTYQLTLCNDDTGYVFGATCKPFKVIDAPIGRKGTTPLANQVLVSDFGPVFQLNADVDQAFAAGLSMDGQIGQIDQFFRINGASTTGELEEAIATQQVDGTQFFAGDSKGNVFYAVGARPAVRPPGQDPSAPIPADGPEDLPAGVHPSSELPRSTTPDAGYFSGSNQPHYRLPGGAWGIDPTDYPDYVLTGRGDGIAVPDFLGVRPQRVSDLLEASGAQTAADFETYLFDSYVLLAEWVKPLLALSIANYPGAGDPADLAAGWAVLSEWDNIVDDDTTEFTLFLELVREVNQSQPGVLLAMRNGGRDLVTDPSLATPTEQRGLVRELQDAIDNLQASFGTIEVRWSSVNEIRRGPQVFPLAAGNSEVQTVFQGSTSKMDGTTNVVSAGSSFLMVTELTPGGPVIRSVRPLGQSEDPASPFFADQTAMYTSRKMKTVPWALADVVDQHTSVDSLPWPRIDE